jgi:hypothetical protein
MIAWIELSSMLISAWAMMPAAFASGGESSLDQKRRSIMPTSCAWRAASRADYERGLLKTRSPSAIAGSENQNTKSAKDFYGTQAFREGLFLILVSRAPAPVWDVHPNRRITRKKPTAYVNHYSFHILDRDWGHITIKISGHPPFPAQVILNGHEYMDRQARKADILFIKDGNCFTHISDLAGFTRIAETLTDDSFG